MINSTTVSCGVKQLSELRTQPQRLLQQTKNAYHPAEPFGKFSTIVFSDATSSQAQYTGTTFTKFIRDNKLGTVVKSQSIKNPNSRNKIATWVWNINWRRVNQYLKSTQ